MKKGSNSFVNRQNNQSGGLIAQKLGALDFTDVVALILTVPVNGRDC